MRFAPVANLAIYEELLSRGQLGTYHLLIATEVAKDWWRWSNFWSPMGPTWNVKRFIIMDNGLIEAGAATDPQTLKEAADAVGASCIVLPDVLGDAAKTIKAAQAAFPELKQLGYPLMGVIQGRNWDEVALVLDLYVRMGIQYLSIPRVMVEIFGTRIKLITRCSGLAMPIHLLGFSENLWDDVMSARQPGVMGIDSAVPLWYPGILPPTPPTQANFGPRPKDYWSMDPNTVNYDNVERVRTWLKLVPGVRTVEEPQGREATP